MGLHERAWSGLNLMVYGQAPLVPMQIEQAIVRASPANEIRIDSFEEYGDAYDFTKDKRSVGFLFILEDCGKLPPGDVFQQLSRAYENKGWPAFGVLIHGGKETVSGLRTVKNQPNLLSYLSIADLLQPASTSDSLERIWTQFVTAFEETLIPDALQKTLLSIAHSSLPAESVRFMNRVSTLLSAGLNITWIESVALKWAPVVEELRARAPDAVSPHVSLIQVCEQAKIDPVYASADISSVVTSKMSLCSRVVATVKKLEEHRVNGDLSEVLQKLGTQSRPGAPALLRRIVANRDQIFSISKEEERVETKVRFG